MAGGWPGVGGWRGAARMAALLLGACLLAAPAAAQSQPAQPTLATRHMVAASHPLAAEAGLEILRRGGSAVDAAIAAQLVLTLVEPQASGIGGGAFLLHYDASKGGVAAYDGREAAPLAATPDMLLGANGQPTPAAETTAGGLTVAVPGVLRMLEQAHQEHGRLPWGRLFEPAMRLAQDGFPISHRLHRLIAADPHLKEAAAARAYFFDERGEPRQAGTRLANPELGETLRVIANGGADAFYNGAIARDIEAAVAGAGPRPGRLTQADLAAYHAIKREPACAPYRGRRVCSVGPPASGVAVLQILGLLERFDLGRETPGSAGAVHLITEASRLALADRYRYLADPAFVPVPVEALLDPDYLAARARLIDPGRSMGRAEPGRLPVGEDASSLPLFAADEARESPSTSHVSVIDGVGNAVALTTSIRSAFGSRVMVRGFLLNNQMTDFSQRAEIDGQPVVNQVEPRKRPRSAMAPTLVLNGDGRLLMTLGSPGGPRIAGYVAKTLVAALDWGLDIQAAIALPHFVNLNGVTELERGTPIAALAADLAKRGHTVGEAELPSGLEGIMVLRNGEETRLQGGADPRHGGVAIGD